MSRAFCDRFIGGALIGGRVTKGVGRGRGQNGTSLYGVNKGLLNRRGAGGGGGGGLWSVIAGAAENIFSKVLPCKWVLGLFMYQTDKYDLFYCECV